MADERNDTGERVGRVETRIDALESKIDRVVDVVDRLASHINKPTPHQWGPILAAVGLVGGFAAGYTTIIANPITHRQEENSADIDYLEGLAVESAAERGVLMERTRWLMKTQEDIDMHGSRRWVDGDRGDR